MRTIYIDSDFKCHVVNDGTMLSVETDFFDGRCNAVVEGYRYVPDGMTWIREDGAIFIGLVIMPWKDSTLLETTQALYEETLTDKERITVLEEETVILKEENKTLKEEVAMLTECALEMSSIIYA